MENFDLDYLTDLLINTKQRSSRFQFYIPDETDAVVTYLPTKKQLYWSGTIGSIAIRYQMQKYGLVERPALRKNTLNYDRIVRKNGKIVRIDSFIDGKPDTILLMHYEGKRRYAFPFSPTGRRSITYTQVITEDNNFISEEYLVSGNQIVYSSYLPEDSKHIKYRRINYVPTGTAPIISKQIGVFTLDTPLLYTEIYHWAWFMGPEETHNK